MEIIKCLKNIPWYQDWSIFVDDRKKWNNITFNGYKMDNTDVYWIDYIINNDCNNWIFEIKTI